MSTATLTPVSNEIKIFRQNAAAVHNVVRLTLDGLTHADSLIQPRPAGNCLNWILGHMLWSCGQTLQLLGQTPVLEPVVLKRYERGSAPLEIPAEAMGFSNLIAVWNKSATRIDAGLTGLAAGALDAPAPYSPTGSPDETIRSLLTLMFFHQAYHTGQASMLRRIAGKEGAIR